MPLTPRQLIQAYSPFRTTYEDLYRIMEILSVRDEWVALGSERFGVVRKIMGAALVRRQAIPEAFRRAFRELEDPNAVHRINDHNPSGCWGG